jgi:hypothetical protein
MTTSDIERTLAEARAAAARRLEALRRAESEPAPEVQGEPLQPSYDQAMHAGTVPADAVIIPRREPPSHAWQAAPEVAVAPTVTPFEAQAAPLVAQAQPVTEHRDAVEANDLQYAAYEPVGAPRDPQDAAGYVPVDPLPRPRSDRQDAPVDHAQFFADEPARKTGLMAGLIAGVAGFRRSRAERRALARENAPQSGEASTPHLHKQRLTAKEQRWERRRKRHLFEEILGWILVPIILVAVYFFAIWILDLFGTTPDALIEGMQTIWSQFR